MLRLVLPRDVLSDILFLFGGGIVPSHSEEKLFHDHRAQASLACVFKFSSRRYFFYDVTFSVFFFHPKLQYLIQICVNLAS